MEDDKPFKPLTREEALNDRSSLGAPMVFKITHLDGTKEMMMISKEGVKKRELREDEK